MAERGRGAPTPPTDTTVHDRDWAVNEITGGRYERTAFVDVDMADLLNQGSTSTGCVFRGVFSHVDLTDAWLHGADFTQADLPGIDPTTVTLTVARIEPAQAIALALGLRVG
ncbi:pentapeptide repeat-containing protein [Saccharothrix australiensis]|uniref:Pentapeptide repeat protein n=1 Tax=Saccharothrix australiensis TaxID=2072 RepID=A0A495VXH2_9PSEU|nr:pentapeptide repeat-containing protein [Saccharothrix australiensis]RKT53894.1 pentapeptide repeat protein [Saccharothrix australiensis]